MADIQWRVIQRHSRTSSVIVDIVCINITKRPCKASQVSMWSIFPSVHSYFYLCVGVCSAMLAGGYERMMSMWEKAKALNAFDYTLMKVRSVIPQLILASLPVISWIKRLSTTYWLCVVLCLAHADRFRRLLCENMRKCQQARRLWNFSSCWVNASLSCFLERYFDSFRKGVGVLFLACGEDISLQLEIAVCA